MASHHGHPRCPFFATYHISIYSFYLNLLIKKAMICLVPYKNNSKWQYLKVRKMFWITDDMIVKIGTDVTIIRITWHTNIFNIIPFSSLKTSNTRIAKFTGFTKTELSVQQWMKSKAFIIGLFQTIFHENF